MKKAATHEKEAIPYYQTRPIALTVFCVFYLFVFGWQFVRLIIPSGYVAALSNLPQWYVISQVTIFYPVGLIGIVGVWFMRRWGVYIFSVLIFVSWILMVFGLKLFPHFRGVLISLGFCIVSFIYIKHMK